MPQMAPLSWLSLYFFFTLLFMLSVILNYYSFLYKPKTIKVKKIKKPLDWKW